MLGVLKGLRNQIAGQVPLPCGILALISKRPYVHDAGSVAMPFIINGRWQKAFRTLLTQLDQKIVAIHSGILQTVDRVVLELIMAHVPFLVSPFGGIGRSEE